MRRIAAVAGLAAALTLPSTTAATGVQFVGGVISPVLGVPVDDSGAGSAAARDGMTVTTQQRGSQLVITVVPAG